MATTTTARENTLEEYALDLGFVPDLPALGALFGVGADIDALEKILVCDLFVI